MKLSQLLEIIAITAGLLNVYLAARANIWNYFFGALMVSLYMLIFFEAKLYADMCLQVVFFVFQFYGLYQWLYGGDAHKKLNVRRADKKIYAIVAVSSGILFIAIAFILSRYTDSNTVYLDAFTTALSLVAQWMLSKKWLENWLLWIVVDLVSIKMYLFKNLYPTAALYGLFLLICVMGYYRWRKAVYQNQLHLNRA